MKYRKTLTEKLGTRNKTLMQRGVGGACLTVILCHATMHVKQFYWSQNNGHGPCQDVCINKHGGYECSCENLPGTNKGSFIFRMVFLNNFVTFLKLSYNGDLNSLTLNTTQFPNEHIFGLHNEGHLDPLSCNLACKKQLEQIILINNLEM